VLTAAVFCAVVIALAFVPLVGLTIRRHFVGARTNQREASSQGSVAVMRTEM